ncbi:MAG: hypothetical protein KAI47_03760 [Deltaproteobacteria bacterium]|nr:hypothetical protein [Deltaproteobacteria bacterium]
MSEVALLISWAGALTLLWSGAAAGMWVLGKRAPTLRVPASMLALVALAKLMLWDWRQIGLVARLAMMACMGTTLLVTPLFFPPVVAGHDHDKSGDHRITPGDDRASEILPISLQH